MGHFLRASGSSSLLLQSVLRVLAVLLQGAAPLHCAIAAGRLAAVRTLLKAGADGLLMDRNGRTPLEARAAAQRCPPRGRLCSQRCVLPFMGGKREGALARWRRPWTWGRP